MSIIRIMKIKEEREALEEMLNDFSDLTGLAAVINDEYGHRITAISNISSYCEFMRAQGNLCPTSDQRGAEIASRIGSTCVYVCHAGLVDLAIPIIYNNHHIGSIMAGQVRTKHSMEFDLSDQSTIDRITNLELKEQFKAIPFMDHKDIMKASRVLEIIAKYIKERLDNLKEVSENSIFEENVLEIIEAMKAGNYLKARQELDRTLTLFLTPNTSYQVTSLLQKQFHSIFSRFYKYTPDRNTILGYQGGFSTYREEHHYFYSMVDYVFAMLLKHREFVIDDLTYAKAYMDRYFYKPLTYKDLSGVVNYSRDHFTRLFKKAYGVSPKEYMIQEKIKHAKTLLIETEKSIQEISTSIGYDDQNYFARTFKKVTGLSPSAYRRK